MNSKTFSEIIQPHIDKSDYNGQPEREYALQKLQNMMEDVYDTTIINRNISVQDRGEHNCYSMCFDAEAQDDSKCVPDWCFYWWNSAKIIDSISLIEEIKNIDVSVWVENKVGWVGNIYSPDPTVPEYFTRPLMLEIGNRHKDILDIKHISWDQINPDIFCTIPQLIKKYKFLIDIGGNGYSGRLKFLLFSRRLLFIVERRYHEYFMKELIPFQHYIPIKEDLSDLVEKVSMVLQNENEYTHIPQQAYDFAIKNLSLEKVIERFYDVYRLNNNLLSPKRNIIRTEHYRYIPTSYLLKKNTPLRIYFMTESDAHISLTLNNYLIYEIILGKSENTNSLLRIKYQMSKGISSYQGSICNKNVFVPITLFYNQQKFSVQLENGQEILKDSFHQRYFLRKNFFHISVSSGKNKSALWAFEKL